MGNESWGCGGNMDAEYYSDLYKRYATFLRPYGEVHPFRIATGPDATLYDGMFEWTEVMMQEAGHMIDGLDMHYYTIVGPWNERSPATDAYVPRFRDVQGASGRDAGPHQFGRGTYTYDGTSIPALSVSASRREDGGMLLTIVNLDPDEGRTIEAALRGEGYFRVTGRILTADATTAHNTFEAPDVVGPRPFGGARLDGERLVMELPAKSIVALELE